MNLSQHTTYNRVPSNIAISRGDHFSNKIGFRTGEFIAPNSVGRSTRNSHLAY